MIYLDYVSFASAVQEERFLDPIKLNCYDSFYPFGILAKKGLRELNFRDITILYGGNGSGKSTALNIIGELIGAEHDAIYNRTEFFRDYLKFCDYEYRNTQFETKRILTSDAVFDAMIDIRHVNTGIEDDRFKALDEYRYLKKMNSYSEHLSQDEKEMIEAIKRDPLANFELLKKKNMANSKTMSKFVRKTVSDSVREHSNGESAFDYFVHKIEKNGIYILDEPENSLSPQKQLELVRFLQDSARFYDCQLIIATHSPFVLSMQGATVYNLDIEPVGRCRWTELESVRTYYEFFKDHEDEFE